MANLDDAQLGDADREFERIRKWHNLLREWESMTHHLRYAWRQLVAVRKVWPGLWFVLVGLLPMRVWYTDGPPGCGPAATTPEEAAELVKSLSQTEADEYPEEGGKVVEFTPEEVRPLWYPGARIERAGWRITCHVIPRWKWGQREWDGF